LRTLIPRRVAWLAALCAIAVSGVAAAQPASNPDMAAMQALQAMQACLVAKARAADDGTSDPDVIAARIKDACAAEEDRFAATARDFATRHPGFEAPAVVTDADRLGAVKAIILQLRKEAHEAH
jgi:hypothetical protein